MPTGAKDGTRARFGPFELHFETGELVRDGRNVRLAPQPTRVLSYFVCHSRQLVTREELQRQLWSEGTFVDFEQGLNFCIRQIRSALEDHCKSNPLIETVPRRGYRFRAEVQLVNGDGALQAPLEAASDAAAQHRREPTRSLFQRGALWLTSVGIVVAIVVFAGRYLVHWDRSPALSEVRITANPTEVPVDSAAISPDGRYLAYSDSTGTYLRQIDTAEVHALALQELSRTIVNGWSSDSAHLLLSSKESVGQPRTIWRVSILGGSPQRLMNDAWFPSASPDGSRIAFLRGNAGNLPNMGLEIWLMKPDGTDPQLLRRADAGSWIGSMAWSPSGRRVAFLQGKLRPTNTQMELQTLDVLDGTARRLFGDALMQTALAWTRDGRILFADALDQDLNNSAVRAIAVDENTGRSKGAAQTLTEGRGLIGNLSVSADKQRVIALRNSIGPQVFLGELSADLNSLKVIGRLTMDDRANNPWTWTPDSETVLFVSRRNGVWNIWKQQIKSKTAEPFVAASDRAFDPRLSPDGSQFFYLLSPRTGDLSSSVKLMQIPVAGGPSDEILADQGIADIQCSRLPSTLCIFARGSRGEITVFPFDSKHGKGSELMRLPDDIHWSLAPDGSLLAIARISENEPRIQLLSLAGKPTSEIRMNGKWTGIRGMDWFPDSSSLILTMTNSSGTASLVRVEKTGKTQSLLEGPLGWAIPSPNSRYLAFTEFKGENNVWMLQNF